MQPVVRGHTADADMPATQNFLPNKRDHDGVINVVVDSVASRYSFESKLRSKAQDPRIVGLQYRVRSLVHCSKFANKCFDYDQRRIEHRIGRTIFPEALFTTYSNNMRDAIWYSSTQNKMYRGWREYANQAQ